MLITEFINAAHVNSGHTCGDEREGERLQHVLSLGVLEVLEVVLRDQIEESRRVSQLLVVLRDTRRERK